MAPWTGAQIKNVPVKLIIADLDITYNAVGAKDYIHKGGLKRDVPSLEELVVMEGVGHFIVEEKSDDEEEDKDDVENGGGTNVVISQLRHFVIRVTGFSITRRRQCINVKILNVNRNIYKTRSSWIQIRFQWIRISR